MKFRNVIRNFANNILKQRKETTLKKYFVNQNYFKNSKN